MQEYWSGLPLPPPGRVGDLPNPRIEPWSPALQADSLPSKPHTFKEWAGEMHTCYRDMLEEDKES